MEKEGKLDRDDRELIAKECLLDFFLEKGYCYVAKGSDRIICPPWFRIYFQLGLIKQRGAAVHDLKEEKIKQNFEKRIGEIEGFNVEKFKEGMMFGDDATYNALFELIHLSYNDIAYRIANKYPRNAISKTVGAVADYIEENHKPEIKVKDKGEDKEKEDTKKVTKEKIIAQFNPSGSLAEEVERAKMEIDDMGTTGSTLDLVEKAHNYLQNLVTRTPFYEELA